VKPRMYLSGPITGMDRTVAQGRFADAGHVLWQHGIECVNPLTLCSKGSDWHKCMRADIKALCDCTHIVMLHGWQESKGCRVELHLAHRLGIEIVVDLRDWLIEHERHNGGRAT
jgi:hypothetical protein